MPMICNHKIIVMGANFTCIRQAIVQCLAQKQQAAFLIFFTFHTIIFFTQTYQFIDILDSDYYNFILIKEMKEKVFVLCGLSTLKLIFKLYENNLLLIIKIIQHFCKSNFLMITYVFCYLCFIIFQCIFIWDKFWLQIVKKIF